MIVVRVELHSAVTKTVTELGRVVIANDGDATSDNPRRGTYMCWSFRGRNKEALDKAFKTKSVVHSGVVTDFPRTALHVWNLVARCLTAMGYK